ncbi:hypothetical protein [Deinococcus arenicola]|uniref:Uncharacterized protein n=1 Tax=Deinococcus arenicola TaxID=2994950 RepID=A0ABU4DVJ0_9DEIO|nr:hypothetical protein [Deinococcus sp. ZS9-10]MDV6376463.1 hypothetical protein [Deinococcus sp. ZS9-10]
MKWLLWWLAVATPLLGFFLACCRVGGAADRWAEQELLREEARD